MAAWGSSLIPLACEVVLPQLLAAFDLAFIASHLIACIDRFVVPSVLAAKAILTSENRITATATLHSSRLFKKTNLDC